MRAVAARRSRGGSRQFASERKLPLNPTVEAFEAPRAERWSAFRHQAPVPIALPLTGARKGHQDRREASSSKIRARAYHGDAAQAAGKRDQTHGAWHAPANAHGFTHPSFPVPALLISARTQETHEDGRDRSRPTGPGTGPVGQPPGAGGRISLLPSCPLSSCLTAFLPSFSPSGGAGGRVPVSPPRAFPAGFLLRLQPGARCPPRATLRPA